MCHSSALCGCRMRHDILHYSPPCSQPGVSLLLPLKHNGSNDKPNLGQLQRLLGPVLGFWKQTAQAEFAVTAMGCEWAWEPL